MLRDESLSSPPPLPIPRPGGDNERRPAAFAVGRADVLAHRPKGGGAAPGEVEKEADGPNSHFQASVAY